MHVCLCVYVYRSSHSGDASNQIWFLPQTAPEIEHKLLHNAILVVFTQAWAGPTIR